MSQLWNSVRAAVARQRQQPAIEKRSDSERAPLTFGQERLWFSERFAKGRLQHLLNQSLEIGGPLDAHRLETSLRCVIDRHEALRTSIREHEGDVFQKIEPGLDCDLEFVDLQHLPEQRRFPELEKLEADFRNLCFDLSRPPLLRFKLIALSPRRHILLGRVHHIIFDRWSSGLFQRELFTFYEQEDAANRIHAMQPPPVQFGDYAVWQRAHYKTEVLNERLDQWQELLKGCAPPTRLPGDLSGSDPGCPPGSLTLKVPERIDRAVITFCQGRGTSLFVLYLTAFSILVSKITGQEDLLFCMPVSGRGQRSTRSIIGFFSNIIFCRIGLAEARSTGEAVERIADTLPAFQAFGDLPFHMACTAPELLLTDRENILFSFLNTPEKSVNPGQLEIRHRRLLRPVADYEFAFSVYKREGRFNISVLYRSDVFSPGYVEKFMSAYLEVLDRIVSDERTGSLQSATRGLPGP